MPAISNVTVNLTPDGLNQRTLSPMLAIPGKQAQWSETTYPELGRIHLEYAMRKADPGSGLVRHGFKAVVPALKSLVTDPSGPFVPAPALDYVTVAELAFYNDPRSTQAQREAGVCLFTKAEANLLVVFNAIVSGQYVF